MPKVSSKEARRFARVKRPRQTSPPSRRQANKHVDPIVNSYSWGRICAGNPVLARGVSVRETVDNLPAPRGRLFATWVSPHPNRDAGHTQSIALAVRAHLQILGRPRWPASFCRRHRSDSLPFYSRAVAQDTPEYSLTSGRPLGPAFFARSDSVALCPLTGPPIAWSILKKGGCGGLRLRVFRGVS